MTGGKLNSGYTRQVNRSTGMANGDDNRQQWVRTATMADENSTTPRWWMLADDTRPGIEKVSEGFDATVGVQEPAALLKKRT
jgi:hypothetical protein